MLPFSGHFFWAQSRKKLSTLKVVFLHLVSKKIGLKYFHHLQMIE